MDLLTVPVRGLIKRVLSERSDCPLPPPIPILSTQDFELCIHLDGSRRRDNGNIGYCSIGENFKDRNPKDICPFYRGQKGNNHICG
ncbi:MAG: hypothetical protein AABY07_09540, partial [Nanoarchaeota archaeon]